MLQYSQQHNQAWSNRRTGQFVAIRCDSGTSICCMKGYAETILSRQYQRVV